MDDKIYPVTADGAKKAHIDKTTYEAMYANSVADPDGFWMEQGKRIDWMKPYTKAGNWTYDYPDVSIKWFEVKTIQNYFYFFNYFLKRIIFCNIIRLIRLVIKYMKNSFF